MAHVILSLLLALVFIVTGAGKTLGLSYANKQRHAMRLRPWFWQLTGVLEWAGAVGLVAGTLIPQLGIATVIALVLFMVGAALARLRAARIAHRTRGLATGIVIDSVLLVVLLVDLVLILLGA